MLNPIILGTVWRIMLNLDGQPSSSRQLLKILLDDMGATAITSASIAVDKPFLRLRILLLEFSIPPVCQMITHKFRGILADLDRQTRLVALHIINAMWNGNSSRQTRKIVIIDALRLFHIHAPFSI